VGIIENPGAFGSIYLKLYILSWSMITCTFLCEHHFFAWLHSPQLPLAGWKRMPNF
jgi:hypothetical protein